MLIKRRSPITGEWRSKDLPVSQQQIDRWQNGELIQNVMPYLSDDDREYIMTGLLPDEWEQLWSKSE